MEALLGNGSDFGLNLSYKVQPSPDGLAQAFILGEEFIGDDACCMILGDNVIYGNGLKKSLSDAVKNAENGKATVFGYYVPDPERFGVIEFDENEKVISIEEKPKKPKSNYAIIGLYFYPSGVSKMANKVEPSERGELEITTLNNMYLDEDNLNVITFGRGLTWLDAGTHESLAEATAFVKMIEEHQGLMISCPEEIAFYNGWISKEKLLEIGRTMAKNTYGQHLINVAEGKVLK
jgi:glucose-1-phosphate thymidylyltransferase